MKVPEILNTLSNAIKTKVGKKKTPFHKLDSFDQRLVLMYLRDNNLNIKVLGLKWYDILSNKFCADEYSLEGAKFFDNLKQTKSFDSFEDFYDYVEGDIYNYSCFFGYVFSETEIKKYNIRIKDLNFDSFIDETIGKYSFEYVMNLKDEESTVVAHRAKRLEEWIDECPQTITVKQLATMENRFFSRYGTTFRSNVFFSILLRKKGLQIKDTIIEYICKEGKRPGLDIDEILIYYGRDKAQYVVEHYRGSVAHSTRNKHLSLLKQALKGYDKGPNTLKRTAGFEPESQLYHIKDVYQNDNDFNIGTDYYFASFKEFATFLSGDLRGVMMPLAPVKKEEVLKYKTDDTTILPLGCEYEKYKLTKEFKDGQFIISQKWIDSDNKIISKKIHVFDKICDFIHFLKRDLSEADLIMCDGVGNLNRIPDLVLDGIKVRSGAANELNVAKTIIPKGRLETVSFEQTEKYELTTLDILQKERSEDDNYDGKISYITDLHLLHRTEAFNCQSMEDANYVIRHIANEVYNQSTKICLIGGDTSSDFKVFKAFVNNLKSHKDIEKYYIFTLGNHELWAFSNLSVKEITREYRSTLPKNMYLIQNSILYFAEGEIREISEDELLSISESELREKMRNANLIFFGGIGFSGKNERFNANAGIYRETLDRAQEIDESNIFLSLYNKVINSLYGKNIIIFTHMPLRDWAGEVEPKQGFIYVSGHTHRNYFYDDGKVRIYSDNQIGYKGKNISVKKIFLNFDYDWFSDYSDGIHEITKNDYETFYRGVNEPVTFNRDYEKLFMVKRENAYMFFMQTQTGRLSIMNGGAIRKAGNHSLEYFYENILRYTKSIKCFLSKYGDFQKKVSSEVKRIGGDGRIHGCIVDIDFFNHLYLNPLDGSIIPYYALSMVDKYVYPNYQSLLKYKCPELYKKYEELTTTESINNSLIPYNPDDQTSNKTKPVYSTEMYKISRILNGLQYTTKYNIVRIWSDALIQEISEESGRLIVSSIIDPDSVPQIELKEKEVQRIQKSYRPKIAKRVIEARVKEEKAKAKDKEKEYKALVAKETNGKIVVLKYKGAKEKTDYRCTVCGYEWSMRSDHFRDRRNYTCPNCSKQKSMIPVDIKWDDEKITDEQKPIKVIKEETSPSSGSTTNKKQQNIGIKTIRKEERSDNADLIVLTFIRKNGEDVFTTRQLVRAMEKTNIEISKNAIINAVSRLLENNYLYLSLDGKLCISIQGDQKLKNK